MKDVGLVLEIDAERLQIDRGGIPFASYSPEELVPSSSGKFS